ncbi:N-acetylmuramoyl-L-alanine amidase [Pseudonocardia sp. RS010]|uniref:N-acetylmuramoyl-L-alanine amidase n=1 Tax=Pseudonocardia sp. RS010 TaxID=3385979 RepID=UPI0039A28816
MSVYVPWLADAARLTGYPVVELHGWRARGHGGMAAVELFTLHHTAGPKAGEYPSLAVVRDGRAGLAGPLAHFGLGRSGTIYVNAAGLAWHAGVSRWAGVDPDGTKFDFSDLNSRALGCEAEDDGDGVWTAEQLDCYPRLAAACLYYMRRSAARVCAHRECATPIGRKPDPAGLDMNAFRARVAYLLTNPLQLIPRGRASSTGTAKKELIDMLDRVLAKGANYHRIICPVGRASGLVGDAYVSVSAAGGCQGTIAFQQNADSDGAPPGAGPIWQFTARNANRLYERIPDGTEYLECWIDAAGDGAVLIEPFPK